MKHHNPIFTGILIIAIAALFLPAMLNAGSLEPSGAPAPTMRTLDEVYSTGSWSRKIPCEVGNCPRFEVLADFNNEAVLDKETGLVWAKDANYALTSGYNPFGHVDPFGRLVWDEAVRYSQDNIAIGGRKGWRLPTLSELASLVDPTRSNPALPAGHPFINIQTASYWSSSTSVINGSSAWGVRFSDGIMSGGTKEFQNYIWPVRGGSEQILVPHTPKY